MALRVAVNDLLFQSAPTNDLPEPAAPGGGALRPMLLARLRSASLERGPAEEAFLLMSADGGRPAIVPAPTNIPQAQPHAQPQAQPQALRPSKTKQNKLKSKDTKRRVARDTTGEGLGSASATTRPDPSRLSAPLGQRLEAMASSLQRADLAERVKNYNAQGMYPAYSYTHGRYTRALKVGKPAAQPTVPEHQASKAQPLKPQAKVAPATVKVKVKVAGDEEEMDAAETIVFRPLFAHRDRHAYKQENKRRRSGLKAVKPNKLLRRRVPRPSTRPAAPNRSQRRTYQRPHHHYQYSPYRRVVYYH